MTTPDATRELAGLMVPVVSTFDADGALDATAFAANVRAHLDAGARGVIVAGSSGEAALLDDEERARLVAWARPLVAADRWLIAGIGAESTRQTIRRARLVAEAGADAVLVVSPHYYTKRMSEAALLAHFTAVADASPVPVLLYNIPVYAHLVLPPSLVHALAAHANVIGMKDSAGDLPVLERYLAAQGRDFRVLTGHGPTLAAAVERGVSGAILAVALYAGPLAHELYAAARRGDGSAAELQERVAPLARDIAAAYGPAGIKAAMDLAGLSGGPVRAPLLALTEEERALVAEAMERHVGRAGAGV